jgi:molybdopterin molybdotransferase
MSSLGATLLTLGRSASLGGRLVSRHEALERLEALPLSRVDPWLVPLPEALGRIVAEDIRALRDRPEAPASAMDGYAFRSSELAHRRRFLRLPRCRDGASIPLGSIAPGHALEVATGDPVPRPADCVVRREGCREWGERVEVLESVWPGKAVRPAGEDVRAGEVLVPRGGRLHPYHLGALIDQRIRALPVLAPRIEILTVDAGLQSYPGTEGDGRPVDPIAPMLLPLLSFARPSHRLVPREPEAFRAELLGAVQRSDLVLTIGGDALGPNDPVQGSVEALGYPLFEGISANILTRCGAGVVDGKPVVVLPGQAVSAVLGFIEFALPLLERLVGSPLKARSLEPLAEAIEVLHRMDTTYLFHRTREGLRPLPWGVARYTELARADAFGVLHHGDRFPAGSRVEVVGLRPLA